jgi:multicomponent K+:H+ antiporter subunit F/multicomponent Na+:H+ antiporter subunit F
MVVDIALGCIMLAQVFGVYRILRGPTWGDRIAALDFLGVSLAVMIVLLALRTGFTALLDAALIVSILGFLSTVALTRYRLSRRLMK